MAPAGSQLKVDSRRRAEIALLLALFFHVAFLYAFRIRPHGRPQRPSTATPDCVFLSPPGEALEWEREIRAWCELADPTLLSLPNESRGFSRVRREERVLPYSDVPPYEYASAFAPERTFAELSLSDEPRPMEAEVSRAWQATPAPVPPEPPTKPLPDGIVWRLPDGTVLAGMPELPEDDVREASKATAPEAPTRVEITRDQRRLRIRVRRPCGSPELDLLLLKAVTREVRRLERQEELGKTVASVLYPSASGDVRTVEVEWRLLRAEGRSAGP